jgi:hypothetical protein
MDRNAALRIGRLAGELAEGYLTYCAVDVVLKHPQISVLLGFLWVANPDITGSECAWRREFPLRGWGSRCLRDRLSKLKGAPHRGRDGLRQPLTLEPLRPLAQPSSAGQGLPRMTRDPQPRNGIPPFPFAGTADGWPRAASTASPVWAALSLASDPQKPEESPDFQGS